VALRIEHPQVLRNRSGPTAHTSSASPPAWRAEPQGGRQRPVEYERRPPRGLSSFGQSAGVAVIGPDGIELRFRADT
jgi:hypothetical protein